MTTGKIHIADHEGQPAGIVQNFQILLDAAGYAAFLETEDGNVRISDFWETEAECRTAITAGGGGIIVIIDDLKA